MYEETHERERERNKKCKIRCNFYQNHSLDMNQYKGYIKLVCHFTESSLAQKKHDMRMYS